MTLAGASAANAGPADAETADAPTEDLLQLSPELARSVNFRIRMAQILAFRHFEKERPGYGGAARFLGLLSIIRGNPGQPQYRLADAVGLQRSSVVPILDRMEAEGIVERRDVEGDRRSKAVHLTDKGEQVVRELIEPALEMEHAMLDGIDAAQRDQLIDGLDRIIENLRRL